MTSSIISELKEIAGRDDPDGDSAKKWLRKKNRFQIEKVKQQAPTEDELFDDRYGYTGQELSFGFTHYLPAYIKLELNGAYLWKNYQNRMVYDLSENSSSLEEHRADQRQVFWGSLSRGLGSLFGLKSSEIYLEAGYLKNISNDVYYQFDNKFGTVGMRFQVF